MTKSALEVVQSFQQSLGSGTNEWTNLLTDEVSFNGPVAKVHGKTDFIQLNLDFLPSVRGYEPKTAFEQNNLVSLEGVYTVESPGGKHISFGMAEIYEIVDGKINDVRVYYDAEEFRKEFGG